MQRQAGDRLGGGLQFGQGEGLGHQVEQHRPVFELAAQTAQAGGEDAAVVRGHGPAGRGGRRRMVLVAGRLGDQPGLIQQLVALQHPALVPAMGRRAVAPVFPREDVEDGGPARLGQRYVGGVGRQGQIADGNLAPSLGARCGAGAGPTQVAEGVKLLDEAEAKAGLGRNEVAQRPFEGAVARGIERTEGQGGGRGLAGRGVSRRGQDAGLAVAQCDDDGRQADTDARLPLRLIVPRRHRYSVCQASAAGIRPTASARTR